MNTKLIEYGILNEGSDYRAHVCPVAKIIYVYSTVEGVNAVKSGNFKKVSGFQPGIKTATSEGYLVPPKMIRDTRKIKVPDIIWNFDGGIKETDSLSVKGAKAVYVVATLIKNGVFPFSIRPEVITDSDMQIKGMDIIVKMSARIQVKCDYKGGDGAGCSGNLFLQVSECNPFGYH